MAAEAERDAEEAKSVAEGLKRKLEKLKARPGRVSFILLLYMAQFTFCSKKVLSIYSVIVQMICRTESC